MNSIDDIFGSSLSLEETHLNDGFREGYEDGLISGKEEGEGVGLKMGFEVGEELGFYRGCIDILSSAIRVDPSFISSRVQKTIKQIDDLIRKYRMNEQENECVSGIMDEIRLKFRGISASLNLKLGYDGHFRASNIEF